MCQSPLNVRPWLHSEWRIPLADCNGRRQLCFQTNPTCFIIQLRGLGAYFLVINLKIILSRRCFVVYFSICREGCAPQFDPRWVPKFTPEPVQDARGSCAKVPQNPVLLVENGIGCTFCYVFGRSEYPKKMPITCTVRVQLLQFCYLEGLIRWPE